MSAEVIYITIEKMLNLTIRLLFEITWIMRKDLEPVDAMF